LKKPKHTCSVRADRKVLQSGRGGQANELSREGAAVNSAKVGKWRRGRCGRFNRRRDLSLCQRANFAEVPINRRKGRSGAVIDEATAVGMAAALHTNRAVVETAAIPSPAALEPSGSSWHHGYARGASWSR